MEKVNQIENNIGFKKCFIADIALMERIAEKAYIEHYSHIWKDGPEFYLNKSFSRDVFLEELTRDTIEFYLIYYLEYPVGIIKINLFKDFRGNENPYMMELEKIYIIKEYTGRKIGATTISFLKHIAVNKNISNIWLSVMTSSKSISFYKKQNFVSVSNWFLDFDNLKDDYREMLIMNLEIKPLQI
ncbi:GNAT family N-acetyltransferase [Ascidiimonas sp. W6]|uniref:GNAT family N-acetyltransferase n=1 Tax=Ascidiimonas meishanensis TaxID=3128903 RepID=UPI0030EBE812